LTNTTEVCFAAVTCALGNIIKFADPTLKVNGPWVSLRTISICPAVDEVGVGKTQDPLVLVLTTRRSVAEMLIGVPVEPDEETDE
jgi:hypothetical protein